MATYAIGDVQGCHETFLRLVDRIDFDPAVDRLWLVGDLVNRGPASLNQLRWVVRQQASVTAVLGNHDLHLVATARGLRTRRSGDTFDDVLSADDRLPLVDWLAARPLLHVEQDRVLVHAGLLPGWSVPQALALAREAEAALAAGRLPALLAVLTGSGPPGGSAAPGAGEHATGRAALALAVLTRLRTCTSAGEPCWDFSGPPAEAPPGCMPWYEVPGRAAADHTVIFGHWAALGLVNTPRVLALDTGCVWGRELTAVRLEDRRVYAQPLADRLR